ncbi:hypothetical protein RIF29_36141 [Crotalaria pallida]|uniref:RING-type E3 ubiquitin transferase n=1 Tax=Crotalaria pallida TaxID=3830 RepID=A0AAN9EB70_CROPI
MGLHHRKLVSDSDCQILCYDGQSCSSKKNCADCLRDCNNYFNYTPPPIPNPPIYTQVNNNKHNKTSTYLIISIAIVATAFFVLCCYAIYAKFFSPWNRSRRRILSQQQEVNHDDDDEFLDEEHGPMVDHPIWYIRTTGLNESIITAITVCKYKKDEGLIEGTDCSVCLSEFEEDESLRLLPKCNHAFHLPCIDTWLRSHTNCPMCRAPIVTNPARILPSMDIEPNVVVDSSSSIGNSNMESLENSGESGMENSDDDNVLSNNNGAEEEEEGQVEVEDGRRVVSDNNMQPRRSVSLDSSSAAKINLALANVTSMELSNGNSKRVGDGNENLANGIKGSSSSSARTRYLKSAPSSMKRSRSYNGKHILLSRYSRSQKKPNNATLVRSF